MQTSSQLGAEMARLETWRTLVRLSPSGKGEKRALDCELRRGGAALGSALEELKKGGRFASCIDHHCWTALAAQRRRQ